MRTIASSPPSEAMALAANGDKNNHQIDEERRKSAIRCRKLWAMKTRICGKLGIFSTLGWIKGTEQA
jgi:hypothetical protein